MGTARFAKQMVCKRLDRTDELMPQLFVVGEFAATS
jgi:hypothetical protein